MAAVSVGITWTLVAADITALGLVQVVPVVSAGPLSESDPSKRRRIVEFIAAGALPAESTDGVVQLVSGETAAGTELIGLIGSSGGLYARLLGVAGSVNVLAS